jgi:hypothetical protein
MSPIVRGPAHVLTGESKTTKISRIVLFLNITRLSVPQYLPGNEIRDCRGCGNKYASGEPRCDYVAYGMIAADNEGTRGIGDALEGNQGNSWNRRAVGEPGRPGYQAQPKNGIRKPNLSYLALA